MDEQQLPTGSPTGQGDLDNFFNISLDSTVRIHLRQAAVWAKITTLCAFTGYGLMLIVAIFGRPANSIDGEPVNALSRVGSIFGTLIGIAIGFSINYFLYRFAVSAIRGIDSMDSVKTNEGLNSLRVYFKILGIILIIALSLAALAFIFFFIGLGMRSRY